MREGEVKLACEKVPIPTQATVLCVGERERERERERSEDLDTGWMDLNVIRYT